MKTRLFETYGIYISIVFHRNLDREPAWRYIIETVEDKLDCSCSFATYEQCEKAALKKAVEFI
jgi:hypothetical protein